YKVENGEVVVDPNANTTFATISSTVQLPDDSANSGSAPAGGSGTSGSQTGGSDSGSGSQGGSSGDEDAGFE
ncbi:MAG: hypothetical protein ACI4AW_05620, partial [Paludibacteraceae bacterium]